VGISKVQETIDKLKFAIQERREVTFLYKDKCRVVQPCACGLYVSNQIAALEGYQVGGESESGKIPGFKSFTVSDIKNLIITDNIFSTNPPGYNPNSGKFNPVYARL